MRHKTLEQILLTQPHWTGVYEDKIVAGGKIVATIQTSDPVVRTAVNSYLNSYLFDTLLAKLAVGGFMHLGDTEVVCDRRWDDLKKFQRWCDTHQRPLGIAFDYAGRRAAPGYYKAILVTPCPNPDPEVEVAVPHPVSGFDIFNKVSISRAGLVAEHGPFSFAHSEIWPGWAFVPNSPKTSEQKFEHLL